MKVPFFPDKMCNYFFSVCELVVSERESTFSPAVSFPNSISFILHVSLIAWFVSTALTVNDGAHHIPASGRACLHHDTLSLLGKSKYIQLDLRVYFENFLNYLLIKK